MKALAIALLLTLFPLHVSGEPVERKIDPAAQAIVEQVDAMEGTRSDALVQMCGMTVMLIVDYDTDFAMVYVGADLYAQLPEVKERAAAGESLMVVDLADAYPPVRATCPDYHYVNLARMKAEGKPNDALMAKAMALAKWHEQHPVDIHSAGVRGLILEHHKEQMCPGKPQGTGPETPVRLRF